MTHRNVHVVHLLVRQNLPDARAGFLLFPFERRKAPDGQPYLSLPAKKTGDDPEVVFLEGMLLDSWINEIVQGEWKLPSTAFQIGQEFDTAEWTMPSPGRKDDEHRAVPTSYTVHPVEVWVAPEEREPLRERLEGRWLTPDEALAQQWLSPTARGVFEVLRKRYDQFKTHPPKPEDKHNTRQAEALDRLFGPVSDHPGLDKRGE